MSAFLQSAVKQLMLVDDDQDNLDLFTIILEYAGFSVKKYSESVKALKEFKSNFYDLVILDYLMPYLDGMQLYNKVKELDSSIKASCLPALFLIRVKINHNLVTLTSKFLRNQ